MSLSISNSEPGFYRRRGASWPIVTALGLCLTAAACAWILTRVYGKPTWQSMAVAALSVDVEIVVLGSSRVHFGVDPRRYGRPLVGLPANYLNAVGMQALWERYESKVPAVQAVVLEMDAVTLLYDTLAVS